jgi:hypothetical protein
MNSCVDDAGDSSGTPEGSSKTESTTDRSDGDFRRFEYVSNPHLLLSGVANRLRPDGVAGETKSTFMNCFLVDGFALRNSLVFWPGDILCNPEGASLENCPGSHRVNIGGIEARAWAIGGRRRVYVLIWQQVYVYRLHCCYRDVPKTCG